jgi:acetyltransferase-like isoleucine patch superfamily enzyme
MGPLKMRAMGRSYDIEVADLGYLARKSIAPLLRGAVWQIWHGRIPNGLMLGRSVTIIRSRRLTLGRGVAICDFAYIECDAVEGVTILAGATLREGAWLQCRAGLGLRAQSIRIGAGAYIGPRAVIGAGGQVIIGAGSQIGPNFTLVAESHLPDAGGYYTSGRTERRGVFVGENVWIGACVTMLDGSEVGDGSVIGASALVNGVIPAGVVAYGIPAKVRRGIEG